jgi:chaperonin cofactor prefoldin
MAYPLHNAINSVDDLATTVRNNAQALYNEMVAVHKYFTGLETRVESLEERVADLLAQNQSLKSTHKELQDQLSTSLVNSAEKDEQINNLERILINGTGSRSHPQKSPTHPDPDVFTGDNRTLLENFLSDLRIKLNMNEDWWATEQKRMGYVLSRLGGKVKAQFTSKVNAEGTINFANVKEMLDLLCITFGIGDEKEAS